MPRRPRSLSAVTVTATAFVAGTARGIRPAHAFTVPQPQESTVKAGRRRHKSGSDASSVASLRAVWRSLEGVTGDDVTGDDGRTSIYEVGSGESFALRLERQRQLNSLDDMLYQWARSMAGQPARVWYHGGRTVFVGYSEATVQHTYT